MAAAAADASGAPAVRLNAYGYPEEAPSQAPRGPRPPTGATPGNRGGAPRRFVSGGGARGGRHGVGGRDGGVDDGSQDAGVGLPDEEVVQLKRPRAPPFTDTKLMSEQGVPRLLDTFFGLRFKGVGHEAYKQWAHRLYPRLCFEDLIATIGKWSTKAPVRSGMTRLREKIRRRNAGEDDGSDDDNNSDGGGGGGHHEPHARVPPTADGVPAVCAPTARAAAGMQATAPVAAAARSGGSEAPPGAGAGAGALGAGAVRGGGNVGTPSAGPDAAPAAKPPQVVDDYADLFDGEDGVLDHEPDADEELLADLM